MFKKIIIYIWELPQHLVALIMLKFLKLDSKEQYKNATVYMVNSKKGFGVSLGNYIILSTRFYNKEKTIKHEYGHTRQSYMFGPLYLLIIGLPSVTQNILSSILYKKGYPKMYNNYYNRYPENWADKLGGVVR